MNNPMGNHIVLNFIGRKIEYKNPKIISVIEIIFNIFSYLMGTDVLNVFDIPLSFINILEIIGVIIGQIMKIHVFHKPNSNAGINDN
jgi:hypothetical protein